MSTTGVKDDNDTQPLLPGSSTTSEQSGLSRQYEMNNVSQSTKIEAYLTGVVSQDSIQRLSEEILDWRNIGRKLKIGDNVLDRIPKDTEGGHRDKVYEMLKKWKQHNGRNATYRILGDALESGGRKDLQQWLEQEACTNETSGEELQFIGMQKKRTLNYIILVSCVVLVACALIPTVFLVRRVSTTADRNPAMKNTTPSSTSMASTTADRNPAITNTTPSPTSMASTTADRNPAITNTTPSTTSIVGTTADRNPAITNTTPSTSMGTTTKLQTSKKYPYYVNIQDYADEPGRHNLILGSTRPGDILLFTSRQNMHGTLFEVQHYTFQYSQKPTETISGVLVRDKWDDDTGGYPELMAGGPGQGYVVVKITSQQNRGFYFSFSVYGRNT